MSLQSIDKTFPCVEILKCNLCKREIPVNITCIEGFSKFNSFEKIHNDCENLLEPCGGIVKAKIKKNKDDKDEIENKEVKIRDEDKWEFKDIIGNDNAKNIFRRYLIKNKEYGLKGKGIVLHGPKGTGKSILLKALTNEPEYKEACNFIFVQTHDLTSSAMGGSSEMVHDMFEKAYQKYYSSETGRLSVLILDDAENVFQSRSDKSAKSTVERTNALLSHIDGLYDKGGVFVILTTNRPEDVDEAIIDRFDKVIEITITEKDRFEFIKRYLSVVPVDDNIDLDIIIKETKNFNGRDFRRLSSEASYYYSEEKKNSGNLTQKDLLNILKVVNDEINMRNGIMLKRRSNIYSGCRHGDEDISVIPNASGR